ncbi:MAG TPA: DNA recombination protein RmuC [Nitrospirae bacterium]|nr:RmuC family protein [bacterium BMS3Abin10]GBE38769.1 RmuC family protein [bacterium BMS3Bbin08]HDH51399.1 DNA recombination protein RmuC [Nitrospirota bacterium]HDK81812.1 DNA recombination protein RmuC [Nitrospirota bacterium]HDO25816.1 DNA recombination protein RmuC [Nitrospirota bacterium]
MIETLLIALLVLVTGSLIVSIILLTRDRRFDLDERQDRMEKSLKEEMSRGRGEASLNSKQLREEIVNSMSRISNLQKDQLDIFSKQLSTLTQSNEQRMDRLRETVEARLKTLQEDNAKKLDQMRETVDEKLHTTLEKRLGESFKLVSEKLKMVHEGLGEMKSLAVGVGDLKKVLSNVKTRGILGELQLENILEQILTPDQYARNVATKKGSRDNVEFAIKLPGKDDSGQVIYLPLDSKFPLEDYHSLLDAHEHGDPSVIEAATKLLENTIKKCAREIRDKYIDPPNTTDFGIMFLPIEGLYAEVVRRTSLIEVLQRDFKIIITGPTTLAAILNSLQMGFRTLAVEKRSSEVWMLLGAVKTEFGKFGDILEKTQKKLQEAGNTIEGAARKSRTIEKKLKNVQELPSPDAVSLIGDIEGTEDE